MLFIPERIKNSRAALVLHLFVAQVLAAAVCAADIRFRDVNHFLNARRGGSARRCDALAVRRVMATAAADAKTPGVAGRFRSCDVQAIQAIRLRGGVSAPPLAHSPGAMLRWFAGLQPDAVRRGAGGLPAPWIHTGEGLRSANPA